MVPTLSTELDRRAAHEAPARPRARVGPHRARGRPTASVVIGTALWLTLLGSPLARGVAGRLGLGEPPGRVVARRGASRAGRVVLGAVGTFVGLHFSARDSLARWGPVGSSTVAALVLVLALAGAASLYCWVASVVSGDTSWVDRLWSILPVIYTWVFVWADHGRDARLDVLAVLVTLWGARLTFNFARKGGYRGVEDYRWAVLRARMTRGQFQLFNLGFIVLVQNALLVLITMPDWRAFQHRRGAHYGLADAFVALLFLAGLALETVADEQQWRFQEGKRLAREAGRTPGADFLTTGLFAYSRHPNYFFELAQWWLVYALGALALGHVLDWTILGPAALTGLFVGSTRFTEEISSAKYPAYRDYQARVSAIVPWPSRTPRVAATPE